MGPQDAIDKFDRPRGRKKSRAQAMASSEPLTLSFGRLDRRAISAKFNGGRSAVMGD